MLFLSHMPLIFLLYLIFIILHLLWLPQYLVDLHTKTQVAILIMEQIILLYLIEIGSVFAFISAITPLSYRNFTSDNCPIMNLISSSMVFGGCSVVFPETPRYDHLTQHCAVCHIFLKFLINTHWRVFGWRFTGVSIRIFLHCMSVLN